jgi:microcystin-dependent protein
MEGYLGEVRLIASKNVPAGWIPCDGRLLGTNDYPLLSSMIGPSFGGDGYRTFALPTLPGPAPGIRNVICVKGYWPSRLTEATLAELRLLPDYTARSLERAALCDGRRLLITYNAAIYVVMGTRFGGDGIQTFAIPNLEAPYGFAYVTPLDGIFPRRS